ncbi:uncharacterized protein LOC111639776 [Centruroides sculpturatus]|uniref:uncharacterized protein LOC111639776 n=1 Tax=Centruroides sculpturatus TaxID=218467 RepID=UPI000C6C8FE4|nr:uncharacterized protein LOC111639776 [Centruroides sculpturatus]
MDPYPGRGSRHLSTHLFFRMDRAMHRKQDSHPAASGFSSLRPELGRSASERPVRPPRISRRSTDTCKYQPGPTRRHLPTNFDDFFNLPPPVLPPELANYCREQFQPSDYAHRPDDVYAPRSPDASPPPGDFGVAQGLRDPGPYSPDAIDPEEASLFHDAPDDAARWMVAVEHRGCDARTKESVSGRATHRDCVIIDLAENAGSSDASPAAGLTATCQLTRKAFEFFRESNPDSEGLLLMDVERTSQFPFVTYVVPKTGRAELHRLVFHLESTVGSQEHDQLHHIAGYEEVAAVDGPEDEALPSGASNVGFIISAFRVFPGEDREKLERHWLVWTGANLIYHRLPRHLGLTRITLHKKVFPERGINYVMVCECATLLDYVTEACVFVDHLRARCCGHTALYRIVDVF